MLNTLHYIRIFHLLLAVLVHEEYLLVLLRVLLFDWRLLANQPNCLDPIDFELIVGEQKLDNISGINKEIL